MSATSGKVDSLLSWCSDNGIYIDSRLRVIHTVSGISVVSATDADIPSHSSLVHIPKSAVLSVKSCSLGYLIPANLYGRGAQLALSMALYIEQLLGRSSRWYGYLQSLPEAVDLPLTWALSLEDYPSMIDDSEVSIRDGREALAWLRGTEIEKQMRESIGLEEIRDYYHNVVRPSLEDESSLALSKTTLSFRGFYHSYSLVSSRAFLVDVYHGLAMVPIADAFNHTHDNHVHLETDFNVCAACGSLHECIHDRGEDEDLSTSLDTSFSISSQEPLDATSIDTTYEMVSNIPIPPDTEVFNTYGEHLTNAQLLLRYGFVLDVNENDCVTWTFAEVNDCARRLWPLDIDTSLVQDLWSWISNSQRHVWSPFSESQFVFWDTAPLNPPQDAESNPKFILNADGKASFHLWLYIALFVYLFCERTDGRLSSEAEDDNSLKTRREGVLNFVTDVIALQSTLESESDTSLDPPGSKDSALNAPLAKTIIDIAGIFIELCKIRINNMGKIGELEAFHNLDDFLESLPDEMPRTRLAVLEVMTERSILQSCLSSWEDLRDILDG